MTTVIPHSMVVPYQQELLPLLPIFSRSFVSPTSISTYSIEEIRSSEHALVLFTRQALSSKRFVMKLLNDYKDTRYSLETAEKAARVPVASFTTQQNVLARYVYWISKG